jgi:hypothetical protein
VTLLVVFCSFHQIIVYCIFFPEYQAVSTPPPINKPKESEREKEREKEKAAQGRKDKRFCDCRELALGLFFFIYFSLPLLSFRHIRTKATERTKKN